MGSQHPTMLADAVTLAKFDVTNEDSTDRSFLLPSPEVQSDDAEILQLAREITAGRVTAREKSRAIYDWVTRNISFDRTLQMPTSAIATLENRSSRCSGYANLNSALHRAVGLRAKVVHGLARQTGQMHRADPNRDWHAWNEIQVGNEWIVQDPTWGEGVNIEYPGHKPGTYSRSWFDPSPRAMELTHRKELETHY
jgi:transglutaminase-like putative cysteine protease